MRLLRGSQVSFMMMATVALSLIAVVGGCASVKNSKNLALGQQHNEGFKGEIKKTVDLKYLIYLPEQYKTSPEPLPLILFLHGAGERGDNLDQLKKHGPPKIVEDQKDFPFIVVSPQCPKDKWWDAHELSGLLDHILDTYTVDEDRVYLTGLSMGGFGTWGLAIEEADRFAAIAPICGGGSAIMALRLGDLPTWVFHGEKDPVVPISASEEMVEALKKRGGDVKFTRYPEAGHDSWTETYDNPELYKWFLRHNRKQREKK